MINNSKRTNRVLLMSKSYEGLIRSTKSITYIDFVIKFFKGKRTISILRFQFSKLVNSCMVKVFMA